MYYFRSYSAKRQKSWNASLPWHLQQRKCQETTKPYRTGQTNTIQPIPNKNLACTCENSIFSNTNWKVSRYVRLFLFNYMLGFYIISTYLLLNTVNTLQFSGHFVNLNRYASFLFCSNCCSSLSRELVEFDLKLFYAIPFWQFFSFKLSINRFIYCMSHRKRKYWIWTLTIIRRFFFVKLTCHISFSSCDFFSVPPFAKSVLVKSRLSNSRFNITIWEHI